jgi:hypothetical protein
MAYSADYANFIQAQSSFQKQHPATSTITNFLYWWTKLRTDPSSTYIDSEGFRRLKFLTSTGEFHYSWSRFHESRVLTRGTYLKDCYPGSSDSSCWQPQVTRPTCTINDRFCTYLRNSFWSKRMAATSMSVDHRFDPENPVGMCLAQRRCAWDIGQELVVIFWGKDQSYGSPVTVVRNQVAETLPVTYVTTAITFRGDDLWQEPRTFRRQTAIFSDPLPISVLYGNFTFTSPTVYIAHHAISANSEGMIEGTPVTTEVQKAGIFPIAVTDIYTLHNPIPNPKEWAKNVAQAKVPLPYNWPKASMERINLDDLREPVAPPIYYANNPICVSAGTVCETLTEGQLRPKLYLLDSVWNSVLNRNGYRDECSMPVVWDPDIVLEKVPGTAPGEVTFPRRAAMESQPDTTATTTTDSDTLYRKFEYTSPIPIATAVAYSATVTKSLEAY